ASWGGVPIVSFTQALRDANTHALAWHGSQAYIAADPDDPYMGLYWAQRQNLLPAPAIHWTSYTSQACALTPPHDTGPAPLVVMGSPGLALASLLASSGARLIQRIPMARGLAYPLYEIAPNSAGAHSPGAEVNGELRLDGGRLMPAVHGLPARLVTRWTALTTTPPGPAVYEYTFHFLLSAPGRAPIQVSLLCAPGSWVAGAGITLAFALPAALIGVSGLQARALVTRDTHSWYQPHVEGLHGSLGGLNGLTLTTAKELLDQDTVFLPLGARSGPGIAHPTQAQINASALTLNLT
ncbi:MAG TPA: hypothetical protein VKQ36_05850, partial [Ktedonobacterales bacterium]|nr:hypothetical protein [Ktedonobacterales bacterium]